LKSFAQQYAPQGLQISVQVTGEDPKLFASESFRNAMTDIDLRHITVKQRATAAKVITLDLRRPDGSIVDRWRGETGPVKIGLALRKLLGEPIYAQMEASPSQ
jgi:hypothetical protein